MLQFSWLRNLELNWQKGFTALRLHRLIVVECAINSDLYLRGDFSINTAVIQISRAEAVRWNRRSQRQSMEQTANLHPSFVGWFFIWLVSRNVSIVNIVFCVQRNKKKRNPYFARAPSVVCTGLEPVTPSMWTMCSTNWANRPWGTVFSF